MRLLLITKRYYMTKDIVLEKYGRQYEIATRLVDLGWSLKAFCLDYRTTWKKEIIRSGGIDWHCYGALFRWIEWMRDISRAMRIWSPDVVLGCSDPLHIIAASSAGNGEAVRCVIDLHDNMDSKGLMRLPGCSRGVRKSLERADFVWCVSQPLADRLRRQYALAGKVLVLENAIPEVFEREPRPDKTLNRKLYGLDTTEQVIGVVGSLYKNRGLNEVLEGFRILRNEDSGVVLALAGPTDLSSRCFEQEGVIYFGNLGWQSVPSFMSMLDIGVVPNVVPLFADYCYPQKAVELCALSIPVVAANMGVMKALAADDEQILYRPEDPHDFARAIKYQLKNRVVLDMAVKSWAQQAKAFDGSLRKLVGDDKDNV